MRIVRVNEFLVENCVLDGRQAVGDFVAECGRVIASGSKETMSRFIDGTYDIPPCGVALLCEDNDVVSCVCIHVIGRFSKS